MSTGGQMIADVLIGAIGDDASPDDIKAFMDVCQAVAQQMQLQWFIDTGVTPAGAAMIVKSVVTSQFDRINAVCAIAASRGYVLPDNPLPRFNQLNSIRRYGQPLGISDVEDQKLQASMVELSKVALAFDAGTVTFERSNPASQIASFEVSVDGISQQSGDPLSDILGYQPDGDFVKRKRAIDALARLDFSKRKPYLLFTADPIRDGKRQDGTIVCWQRMRDASAYAISRRDVFAMIDLPDSVYANDSLERSTTELKASPEFLQLVSFYDWLGPNDYLAFVDTDVRMNTLYSYAVTGMQTRAPSSPFIFDVPFSALYLSAAQADQIRSSIQDDLTVFARGNDIDSISPYPAISQAIYGDPGHGWVLAGVNVLASVRRGDSPDDTRKLSFIGSKASDILALAAAGKLVVPNDLGAIHSSVDAAISSFGVSQTILSILDGTGLTVFIAGKDDPLGIPPSTNSLQGVTGGLVKILSAIDPQGAVIDPHVLASSLISQTGQKKKPTYTSSQVLNSLGGVNKVTAPSIESILGDDVIDLTTYVGINRLIQLIRSIYDFYPSALT